MCQITQVRLNSKYLLFGLGFFLRRKKMGDKQQNENRQDSKPTCTVCNKQFRRQSYLKEHILIHTGEKLHQCNVCDKSFTLKGKLNRHMLTHTGKKSYKFTICNKGFTQRNHLMRHLPSHTGENPVKCDKCVKKITETRTLHEHLKSHQSIVSTNVSNRII